MRIVNNVVCPGCGCVCDDLTLNLDGNRVVDVMPSCPLAERWFLDHSTATCPPVMVDGQASTFETALAQAARMLRDADYPLIYGLARSSTPGQRAAVELADQLGGVIDTTASQCHGPSIMALQNVGESTSTLGEIRNRADLVIFWGCNPAETHPRHAERYSVFPRGQFVTEGRAGRTIVMVGDASEVHDWRLDRAGAKPDVVIPVAAGRDFEAITTLRLLLKGLPVDGQKNATTGMDFANLQQLADRMRACRSGVVFFGLGLTGTSCDHPATESLGHANVECLLRMVAELNAVTRFYARRMRLQGDVSGADTVLCWQTGFPFSVNLTRGYPRYNPGEYSADVMLQRGEPDACLLIGTETIPGFSPRARRHLESIPTIVLDYPATQSLVSATVQFTTAPYGLFAPGTIYRMDEVPLAVRGYLEGPWPTDEAVLRRLISLTAP